MLLEDQQPLPDLFGVRKDGTMTNLWRGVAESEYGQKRGITAAEGAGIVGEVIKGAGAGLVESFRGMANTVGADSTKRRLESFMSENADWYGDSTRKSGGEKWANFAGATVGGYVPMAVAQVGAAALTGGGSVLAQVATRAAGFGVAYLQSYGDNVERLQNAVPDMDKSDARGNAMLLTAIQSIVEIAAGPEARISKQLALKSMIQRAVANSDQELVKKFGREALGGLKQWGLDTLKSGRDEAFEGILQEGAADLLIKINGGDIEGGAESLQKYARIALENGAGGVVIGAFPATLQAYNHMKAASFVMGEPTENLKAQVDALDMKVNGKTVVDQAKQTRTKYFMEELAASLPQNLKGQAKLIENMAYKWAYAEQQDGKRDARPEKIIETLRTLVLTDDPKHSHAIDQIATDGMARGENGPQIEAKQLKYMKENMGEVGKFMHDLEERVELRYIQDNLKQVGTEINAKAAPLTTEEMADAAQRAVGSIITSIRPGTVIPAQQLQRAFKGAEDILRRAYVHGRIDGVQVGGKKVSLIINDDMSARVALGATAKSYQLEVPDGGVTKSVATGERGNLETKGAAQEKQLTSMLDERAKADPATAGFMFSKTVDVANGRAAQLRALHMLDRADKFDGLMGIVGGIAAAEPDQAIAAMRDTAVALGVPRAEADAMTQGQLVEMMPDGWSAFTAPLITERLAEEAAKEKEAGLAVEKDKTRIAMALRDLPGDQPGILRQGAYGQYIKDAQLAIFYQGADASTVVHELFHHFIENKLLPNALMTALESSFATRAAPNEQPKWTLASKENAANAFLAYVKDSTLPKGGSKMLVPAFAQLKAAINNHLQDLMEQVAGPSGVVVGEAGKPLELSKELKDWFKVGLSPRAADEASVIYGKALTDSVLAAGYGDQSQKNIEDRLNATIGKAVEAVGLTTPDELVKTALRLSPDLYKGKTSMAELTADEKIMLANDLEDLIPSTAPTPGFTKVMPDGYKSRRERIVEGVLRQAVYHGTPHTLAPEPGFPHGRFRLDKIGTGEGAQSYGWGIYFADAKGVAATYAKTKEQRLGWGPEPNGTLYRLDIPDDVVPKLLDWDKPPSEQSAVVKAALNNEIVKNAIERYSELGSSVETAQDVYHALAWYFGAKIDEEVVIGFRNDGSQIIDRGVPNYEKASVFLSEIGITGLRYLDQYSRIRGGWTLEETDRGWSIVHEQYGRHNYAVKASAESDLIKYNSEGTRNTVIWDQPTLDRIALLDRNGKALDSARDEGGGILRQQVHAAVDALEGNDQALRQKAKEDLKAMGADPKDVGPQTDDLNKVREAAVRSWGKELGLDPDEKQDREDIMNMLRAEVLDRFGHFKMVDGVKVGSLSKDNGITVQQMAELMLDDSSVDGIDPMLAERQTLAADSIKKNNVEGYRSPRRMAGESIFKDLASRGVRTLIRYMNRGASNAYQTIFWLTGGDQNNPLFQVGQNMKAGVQVSQKQYTDFLNLAVKKMDEFGYATHEMADVVEVGGYKLTKSEIAGLYTISNHGTDFETNHAKKLIASGEFKDGAAVLRAVADYVNKTEPKLRQMLEFFDDLQKQTYEMTRKIAKSIGRDKIPQSSQDRYMPQMYRDGALVEGSAQDYLQNLFASMDNRFTQGKDTAPGATKARGDVATGVGMKVDYFTGMFQHMHTLTHFNANAAWVHDALSLLQDNKANGEDGNPIKKAITETYGDAEYYTALVNYVRRAAMPNHTLNTAVPRGMDKVIAYLRGGMAPTYLSSNIWTPLMQTISGLHVVGQLGLKHSAAYGKNVLSLMADHRLGSEKIGGMKFEDLPMFKEVQKLAPEQASMFRDQHEQEVRFMLERLKGNPVNMLGAKVGNIRLGLLIEKGYMPMQITDAYFRIAAYKTAYDVKVEELAKSSLTDSEIRAKAKTYADKIVSQTMNPADPNEVPLSISEGSQLWKTVMAFSGQPLAESRAFMREFVHPMLSTYAQLKAAKGGRPEALKKALGSQLNRLQGSRFLWTFVLPGIALGGLTRRRPPTLEELLFDMTIGGVQSKIPLLGPVMWANAMYGIAPSKSITTIGPLNSAMRAFDDVTMELRKTDEQGDGEIRYGKLLDAVRTSGTTIFRLPDYPARVITRTIKYMEEDGTFVESAKKAGGFIGR